MRSVRPRGNRNSDGWQKCFTNVPPVLRASQPIIMSKKIFVASAMSWMGSVGGCMTRSFGEAVKNFN